LEVEELLEEVQRILVNMKTKRQNFSLEKSKLLQRSETTIDELTRNLVSSEAFPGTG
jgi:hypothetical protein